MSKTTIANIFLYILAILLGFLSGFLDLTGSEVQLGGFLVFVFAFLLGVVRPNLKTVWIYAVLIGLGVPVMHMANPLQPNIATTFSAVIFGIFGAYIAVFTRKFMDENNKPLIDEETMKKVMGKPVVKKETVPEFKSKYNVPKV